MKSDMLLCAETALFNKNVEHLYRGKRDTEVGSGGDFVVVYERWREDPAGDSWQSSSILKAMYWRLFEA